MTQMIKKILNPDSRRTFFRRFFAGLLGTGVVTAGIARAASEENKVTTSTPPVLHEPFLGQIIMFGGHFAPTGWALCDGQLLPISAFSALFSLLHTTYGGDGETTFGLPDLRGRIAMHPGTGPGLTPRSLGQKSGTETNTLTVSQMPNHEHTVPTGPTGLLGDATSTPSTTPTFIGSGAPAGSIDTGGAGAGTAQNNMQPYQCVNFIIALVGTYPSES